MGLFNYAFTRNPLRYQLETFIQALCSEATNKNKPRFLIEYFPLSTLWSSFSGIDLFHRKKTYVKPIKNIRTRMFLYSADEQTVLHLLWYWEHIDVFTAKYVN